MRRARGRRRRRAARAASGSRARGAVMIAVSSARSQPGGHGARRARAARGASARRRSCARASALRVQHRDDRRRPHVRLVIGMPAVVVGHHRDARVTELRLAGELGLGHVGHADHVAAPAAGTAATRRGSRTAGPPSRGRCRRGRSGMPERRPAAASASPSRAQTGSRHATTCATQPGAEEALGAREGAIDELVDEHEGAGREILAQRAAGADRDQVGDAGALERVDVGAVVDLVTAGCGGRGRGAAGRRTRRPRGGRAAARPRACRRARRPPPSARPRAPSSA